MWSWSILATASLDVSCLSWWVSLSEHSTVGSIMQSSNLGMPKYRIWACINTVPNTKISASISHLLLYASCTSSKRINHEYNHKPSMLKNLPVTGILNPHFLLKHTTYSASVVGSGRIAPQSGQKETSLSKAVSLSDIVAPMFLPAATAL